MKPKSGNAHPVRRAGALVLSTTVCLCILAFELVLVSPISAALADDAGNQPPASTQLAFVRDGQIYLVNSDGTGLVQLTNSGDGVATSGL